MYKMYKVGGTREMNDRFKFRVWSKLSNVMSYEVSFGNFFQRTKLEKEVFDWVSVSYGDNYITYQGDALKELVIMQCTGLKDKNGKLIYEGDIVKCSQMPNKGLVEWFDDGFWVNFFINGAKRELRNLHNWYEVIGNIYENKELLECQK